jgi:hypothetical protein
MTGNLVDPNGERHQADFTVRPVKVNNKSGLKKIPGTEVKIQEMSELRASRPGS